MLAQTQRGLGRPYSGSLIWDGFGSVSQQGETSSRAFALFPKVRRGSRSPTLVQSKPPPDYADRISSASGNRASSRQRHRHNCGANAPPFLLQATRVSYAARRLETAHFALSLSAPQLG
jgi:hypothetical protein